MDCPLGQKRALNTLKFVAFANVHFSEERNP